MPTNTDLVSTRFPDLEGNLGIGKPRNRTVNQLLERNYVTITPHARGETMKRRTPIFSIQRKVVDSNHQHVISYHLRLMPCLPLLSIFVDVFLSVHPNLIHVEGRFHNLFTIERRSLTSKISNRRGY